MHVNIQSDFLQPKEILNKLDLYEGSRIAELGCGAVGHFILPASHIVGDNGIVYAIDVLKFALDGIERMAKKHMLKNVITVWSDIEVYGATREVRDESLDAILLANVCYQLQDHKAVMKEALRMLKKGGKLLVMDWKNIKTPFGPPQNVRMEPKKLLEIGRTLNLTRAETFNVGKYHFGILFEKTV